MAGHPSGKVKASLIEVLSKDEESKSILAQLSERRYNKRSILFMPFHKEDLIFIVKQGKLRVYLGLHGKEISLAFLGPGSVYSTHTRAVVEAVEDTTILAGPTDAFLNLLSQQQAFVSALMGSVGCLMTGAISIIENLYFNCTDKRVAVFFYEQAMSSGKEIKEGIHLKIGLTVESIAKVVGSSRQTVSTLISSMEKGGILQKIARGEYIIRDMRELYLLAHSCSE